MKKIISIFAAIAMLLGGTWAAYATDLQYMIITMNGNGNIIIPLPLANTPTLLVQGDLLEVQTTEINMGYINKNAVKHITYSDVAESQGISEHRAQGGVAVDPRVTHATVAITGLGDGAAIGLYDTAGANCNAAIARRGDAATVDMSSLPAGIYILKVNKESFKIVKK
mgnify:FL=1